ncbi:MAG: malectin domain-containing carbohydrate-binding protein [Bacteroidota bacterium]|jgi:uncharacterized protein YjdB
MQLNIFLTPKCAVRFLGMIVLILLLSSLTVAQIPYVYTVENTGTSYPAPPLPTIPPPSTFTKIALLPDPFAWANDPMGSTRSTAFSDWEHHRNEIADQIQAYEIGTKPAVNISSQVTASYSGGTLTVHVTANGQTLTLTCAVSIPSGATAPYPVCIGMDSPYGSLTSSDFTSRGIVGITFSESQVSTYNSAPSSSDPFYKLYPSLLSNTGQYSAWAWGVSRVIDGLTLVTNVLPVDMNHICVTGCSYAGKMALFAGAFDERVALTIAQESGGGGATSWRYTATQAAGTVEGIDQTSHQWFAPSLFDFSSGNGLVSYLPEDHDELMAMCAPRALYCTGNTDYTWLSNPSCYVCGMACAQIYNTLGIADRFGFNIDGGHSHCAFPSDQESEVQYFLNKFMKGQTSLSQVITTHPSSFDTVNYAQWYKWWGSATNIAVTGVSVSPTTVSISAGATSQLTATVSPSNATNQSVTWSSSNTAVATVSSTGLVTGVANGTATITVTTVDGAKTATSAITVTTSNVPVTGVSVSPTTVSINTGATSQLTATVSPSNATNKNVTWSSSNTAVATVNSTGLVTGVASGTATITVTTADGAKTATSAVTVTQSSNAVNINAGGSATGSFSADEYYSGGSTYTNTANIDMSQITSNVPPAAIFNSERYGTFSYTIPNLTAGSAQTVTLYFAETYLTAAGQRIFNVSINSTSVLSNFDIYASAGGQNKAIARSFSTTANSSGQVVIQFSAVTQSPKVNGITVAAGGGGGSTLSVSTTSLSVGAAANSTGSFSITSNVSWTVSSNQTWLTVSPASGSNNGTVTVTAQQNTGTSTRSATVTVAATGVSSQTVTVTQSGTSSSSVNINCGGSATGSFAADEYFSGGTTYTNTATINMSLITSNVPPAAIFNSERYGAMTYTIPNLTAGSAQTVTLYFAETYLTAAGQRLFNVSINGTTVLSNFDIYATAGGQNKAIAQTFSTTANSSGQVVIQFTTVTQSPKINGITVAGGGTTASSTSTTGTSSTASNLRLSKIGEEEQFNRVEAPKDYSLEQNYPNPFNPTTNISFGLPENAFVSLKVYNSLGQEIVELAGREYSAGRHSVTFDATNRASGVYFYTIRAGKYTSTQKMILQK